MAMKQAVNVPLVVTVGTISGLLLLVVAVGVHAWFDSEEAAELDRKWEMAPNYVLQKIHSEEDKNLHTTAWSNSDKTVAIVPIEIAMKQIVTTGGKLPSTQPSEAAGENR